MWPSLFHIAYTCVSLLYLHRQREQCHCDLFSEIYEHILFTSHLNFMCLLPLRLSYMFLANYVPKCQMSSVHKDLFFVCLFFLWKFWAVRLSDLCHIQ